MEISNLDCCCSCDFCMDFYMDKKGYSKEKANEIAQAIVKREIQRRICKNESCKHFSYDHIRNEEVCLVADCRCREFTK